MQLPEAQTTRVTVDAGRGLRDHRFRAGLGGRPRGRQEMIDKDALHAFTGGIQVRETPAPGRAAYSPPSTRHLSPADLAALQPVRGGGGARDEPKPEPAPRPPLLEPVAPPPPRGVFGSSSPAVEAFLDGLGRLGSDHFRDIASWVPATPEDPRRDERIDEFQLLVRYLRQFATLQPKVSHAILDEIDQRTSRADMDIRPKVARLAWLAAIAIAFADSLPAADRAWVCEPFSHDFTYQVTWVR
jgi:hypothetical protein